MKSWFKKTLLGVVGVTALFAAATAARQNRRFEAPFPDIHASSDPAVIERGRYLVQGPAHCGDCHAAEGGASGRPVPLSGGHEFKLPLGVVRVPNITPHRTTGIGRYGDKEIARMLRHGVRQDGTAMLPFMPFANLSDADLTALISYLRSQKPVEHEVNRLEPTLLGRVVLAFLLEPRGPSAPIRREIPVATTAGYGGYLANSVANCVGCHTAMDRRTGEFTGPRFGGGGVHESHGDPTQTFVTPNLTPDRRWGWIANWSEDGFVRRLQAGKLYPGSPMPWPSFATMSDGDLRAIFRYLRTLPPSPGGPDPRRPGSVRLDGKERGAEVASL